MQIKPIPFQLQLPPSEGRSDGLHISSVIKDIGLQMGYIPPETINAEFDPTRICLGLAWEDWVFPSQHPDVIYHPGEVFHNEIAHSSDGISWFGEDKKVHECKLTWKSMRREADLQSEWLWLSQTMSYCSAWGTHLARYHIYWVNGDYKFGEGGGPKYKLYDLEFTQRELQDNERMLKNRAGMLVRR